MTDDLTAWFTTQLDALEEVARRENEGYYGRHWDRKAGEADSMLVQMMTPVAVLADIAAKRAMLAPHRIDSDRWCRACVSADEYDQVSHDLWPCKFVRLLASSFAHLPGYREEWRP